MTETIPANDWLAAIAEVDSLGKVGHLLADRIDERLPGVDVRVDLARIFDGRFTVCWTDGPVVSVVRAAAAESAGTVDADPGAPAVAIDGPWSKLSVDFDRYVSLPVQLAALTQLRTSDLDEFARLRACRADFINMDSVLALKAWRNSLDIDAISLTAVSLWRDITAGMAHSVSSVGGSMFDLVDEHGGRLDALELALA